MTDRRCVGKPSARGRPCSCPGCVSMAIMLTMDALDGGYAPGPSALERIAMVLRACVMAGLVEMITGGAS